jgi:hypothetical protein
MRLNNNKDKVEYTDIGWLKRLRLEDSFLPLRTKTIPAKYSTVLFCSTRNLEISPKPVPSSITATTR